MKKNRLFGGFFAAAVLAVFLLACSNPAGPGGNRNTGDYQAGGGDCDNPSSSVYMYAAGRSGDDAVVWRNGEVLHNFGPGTVNYILMHDGVLYAAGTNGTNGIVWRSGEVLLDLGQHGDGNNAFARVLFERGGAVYVAGRLGNNGTIWRIDGTVASTIFTGHSISSVFVSGDDVFAAGQGNGVFPSARVWRNSVMLHNWNPVINSGVARSIVVSNDVVYTAGRLWDSASNTARVWRNGEELYNMGPGVAHSIFLHNGFVYTAGHRGTNVNHGIATIWRDGVIAYTMEGTGTINSLIAHNGFVYAAGHSGTTANNGVATIWQDGSIYRDFGPGTVNSLLIVER